MRRVHALTKSSAVNMAPRGVITVTTVLLCLILSLLSPAPEARSHKGKACCTGYNRKPVPFQRIKGYREQTAKENCHIDAIIFYTVKKNEICATQKDEWVRKTLKLLSSKLKRMSDETQMNKSGTASFHHGQRDGSFFSTTETFPHSTEGFYKQKPGTLNIL